MFYGTSISVPLNPETELEDLVYGINQEAGATAYLSILSLYILTGDINEQKEKLNTFFSPFIPQDIEDYIRELLIPNARATLELSAGLEFPRNMLKPVYDENGISPFDSSNTGNPLEVIPEDDQGNPKVILSFGEALFYADTEKGLGYNMELVLNTNVPAQIGNTGLIIDIQNLKIDLSREENILEANLDGRPPEFMGVFTEYTAIILPKKWFNNVNNSTLRVAGYNMLIGTGGISGTVALETIGGVPNNGNAYLDLKIGNWQIGFNHFDVTFHQNAITNSHIEGRLLIPKLKDGADNDAEIIINGHLYEDGDFNLTASEPQGIPLNLFDFVTINFLSLELGKQDDNFYLGTSCEIWFENSIMQRILGDQKITIPRLRIYDNGSMEIVGGNAFIPTNISLNLGPIEIAVTGIHFGSYQQEHNGNLRKYNYWGFDGAISIDPLGVDVRGEGVKYYYTTDNDEFNDQGHSFLRIQTIEVDLIIPGTASPESAMAIIHGMVSIPEPGVSQEYIGEVGLKLPKANVSGYAKMRLMPKEPAFLIEAGIELPTPIPLAATGLAFYGFGGLLGFKYVAEKEAIGLVSGVDTWYDYYTHPQLGVNQEKFSGPPQTDDYNNPFAIGAGAVIGTMSDDGYLFSTRLMLILSLPSVFIIDGRANLLDERLDMMGTTEPPFFAGMAIGDSSVEFWFGADYQLPKSNGWIIDLQAEVQAGFFKNNPSAWYVNFGTIQNPISARVLSIITAQSYLMISAQGIEAGARVEFELNKRFGPARVRFYAYFEMGGYISFERPQIGGYIALGGEIYIKIWIIRITIGLDALLVVEAAEPFLIYAELRIKACIKILWRNRCKRFTIKLKWQKNNTINRAAIPALPNGNGPSSNQIDRRDELVLGVHMLTNETFALDRLDSPLNLNDINTIIPLDTYIDIKVGKGLIPNALQNIGGVTNPPENYTDLIPPNRVVRGGHEVRQVKHKYSIEQIELEFWNGNNWQEYHPYKALTPSDQWSNVENLKIGYWQKSGKQYDAIRLLATTPFSYTEQGEPGWFIPEQYGITASSLFCEGSILEHECANALNLAVGLVFYPPTQYTAHYIDGAYFTLDGEYYTAIVTNQDGTQQEIIVSNNTFVITDEPNPHNFPRSIQFSSSDSLIIILPESSVETKLQLTTYSEGVTIAYYTSEIIGSNQIAYTLIQSHYKTAQELQNEIIYNVENDANVLASGKISKIIIKPNSNCEEALELQNQINILNAETNQNIKGKEKNQKQNEVISLQKELDIINSKRDEISESNINSLQCSKNNWLCMYHDKLLNLFNNYFVTIESQSDLTENIDYLKKFRRILKHLYETPKLLVHNLIHQEYEIFNTALTEIISHTTGNDYQVFVDDLMPSAQHILNLIHDFGDCDCNSSDCVIDELVCNLREEIEAVYNQYLPVTDDIILIEANNQSNMNQIHNLIKGFDPSYGFYGSSSNIGSILSNYDRALSFFGNPTEEEILVMYNNKRNFANQLIYTLGIIGNCNCQEPVIQTCVTSLQQVCWLSVENYEYNLNIPEQEAIEEDFDLMTQAIQHQAQPIWRPNTAYRMHFKLKDEVDDGENEGLFNYYYGFKTAGPIGHFHNANGVTYGEERDGNGLLLDPDKYALTSLRQYIDYNRSYPNANGNLLKAKPLFYGQQQCKITLFFTKAYVTHMLNNWNDYNGSTSNLLGELNIMIKDPVSNEIIPYPLPIDYNETIPEPQDESWTSDDDPLIPLNLQIINNFIENIENNNIYTECILDLGEPIVPNSPFYSVVLTNLKPQKLYTAIINNAFDINSSGTLEDVETVKIHDFVFQTSRYKDFRKQIESYQLKELNDLGEIIQENQAIFTIDLDLSTENVNTVYNIIAGNNDSNSDILETQFYHLFDRVVEGVLGFNPVDPPISTEFNLLKNSNTGNIIGILIRNPEPFNNPNIPVEEIQDTFNIMINETTTNLDYHVLHSKDYSQIMIMNNTKNIAANELLFRFQYKIWDGLNYIIENELDIPNDERKNVVFTNININSEN